MKEILEKRAADLCELDEKERIKKEEELEAERKANEGKDPQDVQMTEQKDPYVALPN